MLITRLGVRKAHLLGHSHGAFVAAYHALHRSEQLAGVVLYEGAPVTGPEHGAEAGRMVEAFAAKHAHHPGLPGVLAAFGAMSGVGRWEFARGPVMEGGQALREVSERATDGH